MKVIESAWELSRHIDTYKKAQKTIGLVPTMGALHEGHLSLIQNAKLETDIVIVSIFVNRKQFNNPKDFDSYPRNLEKDLKILGNENDLIVFAPTENDVFPTPEKLALNFGILTEILEAKYRPGHFEGVAEVVNRFFKMVQPHKAFFGKKDFQQLLLVKKLVEKLSLPIDIIACQTVRNSDGLALSSRNQLLNELQKKQALILFESLSKAKRLILNTPVETIKKMIFEDFEKSAADLEYFEIVDSQTLEEISEEPKKNQQAMALIAAYLGGVRLIDNMSLIP